MAASKGTDGSLWAEISAADAQREAVRQRPDVIALPKKALYSHACQHIFEHVYGYRRSMEEGRPVDAGGNPLPLYTYPAIEYLRQLDFSRRRVFEFGAGASTFFWMTRAKEVVSLESNPEWYQKLQGLGDNVRLLLETGDEFPNRILDFDEPFDVVIVDAAGYRYDCADRGLKRLAPGGMLILDNADWHHRTAAMLREQDLMQIDMTGFKPTEPHTSTTSLFLRRDARFQPAGGRQPHFGMGAKEIHSSAWDKPYAPNR